MRLPTPTPTSKVERSFARFLHARSQRQAVALLILHSISRRYHIVVIISCLRWFRLYCHFFLNRMG